MKKEAINPHNVWKPEDYFNIYHSPELPKTPPEKSGWEQAVRHGNWLFISGQTPTTLDGKTVAKDMHAQVRQALENTRNILKAVGGTTDDIMSIRYYFKAGYMEEGLAALRDLGSDYFKSPYPSITCVEVVRVAWADHLLEIEAVAILGGPILQSLSSARPHTREFRPFARECRKLKTSNCRYRFLNNRTPRRIVGSPDAQTPGRLIRSATFEGDLPFVHDERRRDLISQQRSTKRAGQLPRLLPATPKRIRNALQGDSALQVVSMSQSLT